MGRRPTERCLRSTSGGWSGRDPEALGAESFAALYFALAADGFGSPWALDFESFVANAYAPGA